jgi:4-hydroxythreonine-4-phosphate dehydrogenase
MANPEEQKIKIGITCGDLNGVGMEVAIKTLSDSRVLKYCTPIIYASTRVLSYYKNVLKLDKFNYTSLKDFSHINTKSVNVVNCWEDKAAINIGEPSQELAEFALKSLEAATNDLINGKIEALVTSPVNKNLINKILPDFSGHTEYLTQKTGAEESVMLMLHENIKVALVTNHLPISEVAGSISKGKVLKKINIFSECLQKDFGIAKPLIAVLGLNPHAGDDGLVGHEETEMIIPAIQEAQKAQINVIGPFPADGFFGSGNHAKFDGILAMYHDQGLIPFKTLSFDSGINYTAGLPFVRTSPDHGPAYDIAGKNVASHLSFMNAMFVAIDVVRRQKDYAEMTENPIKRRALRSERK